MLAWRSIKADMDDDRIDIDASQKTETANNIARCDEAVNLRIKEVYCRLIVPRIDVDDDMKTTQWDVEKLNGAEPIVHKVAAKMRQNEQIIEKWAPALLKMELDNLLWKEADHIQVKTLWDYLTTYCYLPRLKDFSVLEETIRVGVAGEEFFALASSVEGDRYAELKYNKAVLKVYPSDYLVKVPEALKQIVQDMKSSPEPASEGTTAETPKKKTGEIGSVEGSVETGDSRVPTPPAKDTRFFMSVPLDNTRVIRDLRTYLDEVISHFGLIDGCELKITLEVDAQANDGFPQDTVRTVSENCKTLKVEDFGFEK